ncbi:hypothetical protein [Kitasatospora sp. NPDC093558]|uniref:hypothetical protein n=1 Tax=Kitasatospora sp. NPDC093558 TaxID=3155201 RepID=UPI003413D630
MTDAEIRIPVEARDRLAAMAAAEQLSLRAYLVRLAGMVLPRADNAEQAKGPVRPSRRGTATTRAPSRPRRWTPSSIGAWPRW